MIVLDTTIVNVALPSIRDDLGFSEASLAWVVNAYLLTFGGFLLLGRTAGGSLRTTAIVSHWNRAVHGRLTGLRTGSLTSIPYCGTSHPRVWRRYRCSGRTFLGHEPFHETCGTSQGHGNLWVCELRRWIARCAPRRNSHQFIGLALDLLSESPLGNRGGCAQPQTAPHNSGVV